MTNSMIKADKNIKLTKNMTNLLTVLKVIPQKIYLSFNMKKELLAEKKKLIKF